MAYSDYGGYGYRNGVRVEDRSDYTIMPDGSGVGTPGAYPGFAAMAAGASGEEVKKFVSHPHHHVVLGDGPIFIGMHKQSSTLLYRGGERLEELSFLDPACCDALKEWKRDDGTVQRYVDSDWSINNDKPLVFNIDCHRLEVVYEHTDNYYQYARLTQPDGTVWTGFSGYGVGAGLEDCGYGYDTSACEDRLVELFPHGVLGTLNEQPKEPR